MFLDATAKTPSWVIGSQTKGAIQVAPRRKTIVYDNLPHPGIGKLGFRWNSLDAAWEDV
jgi:hypothetical protein